MTSQWDMVRSSFERAHDDFFGGQDRYSAEFFNYTQGTRDNLNDEFDGESRVSIGTAQVEFVPPSMDTTVDVEGTSFSWDASIRFPETESITGSFSPLGEDNQKPTEVEISDEKENENTVYELHGYSPEKGSGMVMCQLVEQ